MPRHLLQLFAFLACTHSGSLVAQDGENLGALLPSGQSMQRLALLDQYSKDETINRPFGGAGLQAALDGVEQEAPKLRLRGARDMEMYRALVGAVPLVVAGEAMGSGSLIAIKPAVGATPKTGVILTNWHVVGDEAEVGIVFKPRELGDKIDRASVLRGRVRKVDRSRDLALVEVTGIPSSAVPIDLGALNEVQVGADVHAIGHPEGQTWTYTKGLISQIRPRYEWQTKLSGKHIADVIQTQTPINPGNSGGPLVGDSGRLIGVNSFKKEGEGLNFAVSVGEVRKFLAEAEGGAFEPKLASASKNVCEAKVIFEGRASSDDGSIRNVDMNCTGKVNATLFVPDNKGKPIAFRFDRNNDGKVDVWIFDEDRDGKWDRSLWDEDFDGKPDLIGYHPDGEIKPSRFEKYRPKS